MTLPHYFGDDRSPDPCRPDDTCPQCWYVATLARYVLVQARDAAEARARGEAALGGTALMIRTVRLASADEIELQRWHDEQAADDTCPQCGGSGGGEDPPRYCPLCGGKGHVACVGRTEEF